MQIATVEVRLSGSREKTVHKENVTAPEIVILKTLHGADSVKVIKLAGMDRRSHSEEAKRLRSIYGSAKDEKDVVVMDKLFPGHSPTFPVTLADIGLEITGSESDEATTARPKGRQKKTPEPKLETEPEPEESEGETQEGEEPE